MQPTAKAEDEAEKAFSSVTSLWLTGVPKMQADSEKTKDISYSCSIWLTLVGTSWP